MKKIILPLLLLFATSVYSQPPKLRFVGDSVLSSNIGEWQKYHKLYLVTSYRSTTYYKFILTLTNDENKIVLATDSVFGEYDSLGIGDTMRPNLLFNQEWFALYDDNFADHFANT